MSDYVKAVDYASKDALASGNAGKVVKGTEIGNEFDLIATAVATKYDVSDRNVALGLAPLDASSLVPSVNLPAANTTTVGALETATSAEATALTLATKIIVPSVFGAGATAWASLNGGIVNDLQALAAPGADRVLGYDQTTTSAIGFTLGNALDFSGTTLVVTEADISLTALGDYDANDHIDHTAVTLTAGVGLTGGGTIAANRTFNLDFSALTNRTVADTAATDSIVFNNGGVMEQIDIQDMGVRVVESTAVQTFAVGDANTLQLLTGVTARIWDIPTSAVAFPIGAVIYVGSRDTAELTLSPNTSAVTLTSALKSDIGPSAGDQKVKAGGMAALVKVAANEWMLSGDITL